ncbi:MAG: hypothetical protein BYD32DRAFT_428608 [Podila humilis]|nr:MAG: hypothetical protein BYD32DRAFT_428608 [Podila humilis]
MRQHKEQHNSKFRPNRRAVPFDCVTQAIPSHPIFALSFFFFLLFRQSFMMTSLFHILCSTLFHFVASPFHRLLCRRRGRILKHRHARFMCQ